MAVRNLQEFSRNFIPFPFEWWHFDYTGWENYPPLDIGFESQSRGVKTAVPVE